jgi:hypothetical protein
MSAEQLEKMQQEQYALEQEVMELEKAEPTKNVRLTRCFSAAARLSLPATLLTVTRLPFHFPTYAIGCRQDPVVFREQGRSYLQPCTSLRV